jgi:hypothetical protein
MDQISGATTPPQPAAKVLVFLTALAMGATLLAAPACAEQAQPPVAKAQPVAKAPAQRHNIAKKPAAKKSQATARKKPTQEHPDLQRVFDQLDREQQVRNAQAARLFMASQQTAAATTGGKTLTTAQVQNNPLVLLQNIVDDDLKAALADAKAQTPPDMIGANCYQALLDLKTNAAFNLPGDQVPGIFTAIQKARDLKTQLANLSSASGPLANLNMNCAAWTQDNLLTLVNVGVAVGLVTNPVGATAAVGGLPVAILGFLKAFGPIKLP